MKLIKSNLQDNVEYNHTQMTDWKENDRLIYSLRSLFIKFDEIIEYNKENSHPELYWDDTYFIYGIALVSLQNYINQNCKDFLSLDELNEAKKNRFYKLHSKEIKGGITEIQLIIHLANYFKHSDDEDILHRYTLKCLQNVSLIDSRLSPKEELTDRLHHRYEYYAIVTDGIDMITSLDKPMMSLLEITSEWRESIWEQFRKVRNKNTSTNP